MKTPMQLLLIGLSLMRSSPVCSAAVSEERIGPAPSPLRQSFNCTDRELWQEFPHQNGSIRIGLDGGLVSFIWLGSTSPQQRSATSEFHEFDPKRWSQQVRSSQALELRRGFRNLVRMVWRIRTEEPEFGAIVTPMAILLGPEEKELGLVTVRRMWLPTETAPGRAHTVGVNFEPLADAVQVIPALQFTGNSMRCVVESVFIEPTAEAPQWDPRQRTDARMPEVRYYDDGLRPTPDSPQLTSQELDEYFATCPKARAEVRKVGADGPRVELVVDGERIPPTIHLAAVAGLEASRFGDFA
ncbi:MAG: hypothetical protein FJ125_11495, partial [Deltaproteobacteria bacterium]|nr:hypothetical protein [Deltaproteobacteria bacterium]